MTSCVYLRRIIWHSSSLFLKNIKVFLFFFFKSEQQKALGISSSLRQASFSESFWISLLLCLNQWGMVLEKQICLSLRFKNWTLSQQCSRLHQRLPSDCGYCGQLHKKLLIFGKKRVKNTCVAPYLLNFLLHILTHAAAYISHERLQPLCCCVVRQTDTPHKSGSGLYYSL